MVLGRIAGKPMQSFEWVLSHNLGDTCLRDLTKDGDSGTPLRLLAHPRGGRGAGGALMSLLTLLTLCLGIFSHGLLMTYHSSLKDSRAL